MWTADLEVNLFHALTGHKVTGINRYFHMACVYHKLMSVSDSSTEKIRPENVWTHLKSMFNIDTLNELDELPFSNEENEFQLPEEMTNPEFMSAPSSPALSLASPADETAAAVASTAAAAPTPTTSTTTTAAVPAVPARPFNLPLATNTLAPENLLSPKRKRNSRQPAAQLATNSQPSSPASTPGGTTSKRRR